MNEAQVLQVAGTERCLKQFQDDGKVIYHLSDPGTSALETLPYSIPCGLKTGGRVESILMSLPPAGLWPYAYQPERGARETELYDYLRPQDETTERRGERIGTWSGGRTNPGNTLAPRQTLGRSPGIGR